jgi:hypothetical protein
MEAVKRKKKHEETMNPCGQFICQPHRVPACPESHSCLSRFFPTSLTLPDAKLERNLEMVG